MRNAARLVRDESVLFIMSRTGSRMEVGPPRDPRRDDPMDTLSERKFEGCPLQPLIGFLQQVLSGSRVDGECLNCGRYGHSAKDCWAKDTPTTERDGKENERQEQGPRQAH